MENRDKFDEIYAETTDKIIELLPEARTTHPRAASYLPGGHGTMWDLAQTEAVGKLTVYIISISRNWSSNILSNTIRPKRTEVLNKDCTL